VRESERDQICQWFERLTLDDALRESVGREAATMVEDKFGLSSQVAKLEDIYLSAAKR
jgi:hypothetical protein